jgi:glutathione-independent formaldehyde dehydrogenase
MGGKVELLEIEYPKLALGDRKCEHGVILKIIATNMWFRPTYG